MINRVSTPEMAGAGSSFTIPAPLLGLNTRDNYTQLQPTEARVLENWFPDEGACSVRLGHASHQLISGATSVRSLMVYRGATQSLLIAAAGGEIYDVTSTPSLKTSSAAYTNNIWSHENLSGWLFGVNGSDTPWRYNGGGSVAATGFSGSGLTLSNLQTVKFIRNRLWFTEKNSADVWYGGISSVTGTLTKFQLSQIASGGKCVALGSWSRDAGDGADDLTVFVMNTGEIIVYQGDPATNFQLVGKYRAPEPVGIDAVTKVGGELVVLTVNGPMPVTAAISGLAFNPEGLGVWGKIAPSWQLDYRQYGSNLGWNAYFFNGVVYFNIATGLTATKQYVYNTRNSAWTVYTGMPVSQFADLGNALYFGSYSDAYVYRHATGTANGSQITTLARQGASYPGGASQSQRISAVRPNIDCDGNAQYRFAIDTDFTESALGTSEYVLNSGGSGASWGDDWDSDWASPQSSLKRWQSARGYGRAISPVISTSSTADNVLWYSTDMISVRGGMT